MVVSAVATSRSTGVGRIRADGDVSGLDGGWAVDVRFVATATPGCDGVGLRERDGGLGVSGV